MNWALFSHHHPSSDVKENMVLWLVICLIGQLSHQETDREKGLPTKGWKLWHFEFQAIDNNDYYDVWEMSIEQMERRYYKMLICWVRFFTWPHVKNQRYRIGKPFHSSHFVFVVFGVYRALNCDGRTRSEWVCGFVLREQRTEGALLYILTLIWTQVWPVHQAWQDTFNWNSHLIACNSK